MTAQRTLENRVETLEATVFRHGHHLEVLDRAVDLVSDKLDDMSGQVRETRLGVRELGDRVGNLEARLDGIETLLGRIASKLGV